MKTAKLAIDPLWRYLCPSWTSAAAHNGSRVLIRSRRPITQCLKPIQLARAKSDALARREASRARDDGRMDTIINPIYMYDPKPQHIAKHSKKRERIPFYKRYEESIDLREQTTEFLYRRLRIIGIDGKARECEQIAQILVKERNEKPSLQIYSALILSNVGHEEGTAWKAGELLDEIKADGLELDVQSCHAALKVLGVHPDHLLRTDILEYMSQRWLQLSEDGAHDVAAGLFREGLFEQALERVDKMRGEGMHIHGWLLDMAVYVLCEANEISEAYRIIRQRVDSGDLNLGRSVWSFFLDKASQARHHTATALAWSNQVKQNYINPSSGTCLNVLATAARAADAVMATEVFTHLSKRGTTFEAIHYELLISTYLAMNPPDVNRAITILTIMALEKLEPTSVETRSLHLYLRDKPGGLLPEALNTLRELHNEGRKIPIAALNLLIECYVEQGNLSEALKIYKQIHTFAPIAEGAQKTFANIETFNLLLKGCRTVDPPDAERASFLVSELLALRIKPTSLTYDRLILVFTNAGQTAINSSFTVSDTSIKTSIRSKGVELIDWAFRHFADMQALKWAPRFGSMEKLSVALAGLRDERCWDVLQVGEDQAAEIDGWERKGGIARRNVEKAWEQAGGAGDEELLTEGKDGGVDVRHLGEREVAVLS